MGWMSLIHERRGQATVELAVLIPAIIVVGLIGINLGFFIESCGRFDRVSQDMVLAHGTSPAGEQSSEQAIAEITQAIQDALCSDALEVSVRSEKLDLFDGSTFSLNPARVRFVCDMKYTPVPASFSIGGISINSPFVLQHTREIVVDASEMGF